MTTKELLKKLFAKAGITIEGEIGDEIPDDQATQLDNSLMTLAAATNNHPAVKKVYFAQAYNGLDAEINDIITEFQIPDEVKQEIERAGGSTKRATALIRKIKELSEKVVPADKSKAAELQAEVTNLHTKLAAEIKKQTDIQADYEKRLRNKDVQHTLVTKLTKYKTVYDELDPEAKSAAVNAIINKSLQDQGAEFTFDENGSLVILKKDGTNLFGDNHTQITPDIFLDKSLSKILKVSNNNTPNPVIPRGPQQPNPVVPSAGQNQPNYALSSALQESLAALEQSAKNGL